jgi:DNA polymerase-3 subunit epsilon
MSDIKEIAVLDIETSGLNPNLFKILEIGVVKLNLETGITEQLMNYVCHEDGITLAEINNAWIIQNSTLTAEQIKYSVNFKRLILPIQTICNTYPVTAFNSKFDFGFLESRGIKIPNKFPDPMLILEDIMKLPHKSKKSREI